MRAHDLAVAAALLVGVAAPARAGTLTADRTQEIGNDACGGRYRGKSLATDDRTQALYRGDDKASANVAGRRFDVLTLRAVARVAKTNAAALLRPTGTLELGLGPVSYGLDLGSKSFSRSQRLFEVPVQLQVGPIPVHLALKGSVSVTIPLLATTSGTGTFTRAEWGPSFALVVEGTLALGFSFAHVGLRGDLTPLRARLAGFLEARPTTSRVGVAAELGWSASLAVTAKVGVGFLSASYTKTIPGLAGSGSFGKWELFAVTNRTG